MGPPLPTFPHSASRFIPVTISWAYNNNAKMKVGYVALALFRAVVGRQEISPFFPFQVEYVMHYYGIPHCVCLGVGLGANVLARFARRRPTMVEGLVLINCSSQA